MSLIEGLGTGKYVSSTIFRHLSNRTFINIDRVGGHSEQKGEGYLYISSYIELFIGDLLTIYSYS